MIKIGFWSNQLSERGTDIALYDYAYYNQIILKNERWKYTIFQKNIRFWKFEVLDFSWLEQVLFLGWVNECLQFV